MQPIRVTYNQACELLSISQDTLRNLTLKDSTFPKPYKYGSNRQSPVYLEKWHDAQKANAVMEA